MYAFRRLFPFLRRYRWHMLIVILSAGGITAMNLVNPWLVRELVQNIRVNAGDDASNRIIQLAAVLLVIFILRAACRYLYLYIAHVMAYSFVDDLRVAVYDHLQRLSARFFADRQTGELIKRIINDTRDIEPLIAHYIPDMTVNVLLLVGVGIILFNLNASLALLTLLPMPLLLVSNLFLGKRMNSAIKDSSRRLGVLTGIVQDNLVGIREIQLFTQERREHARVTEYSTDTTRTLLYGLKMQAFLSPSIEFLTGMGLVIVSCSGGRPPSTARWR